MPFPLLAILAIAAAAGAGKAMAKENAPQQSSYDAGGTGEDIGNKLSQISMSDAADARRMDAERTREVEQIMKPPDRAAGQETGSEATLGMGDQSLYDAAMARDEERRRLENDAELRRRGSV